MSHGWRHVFDADFRRIFIFFLISFTGLGIILTTLDGITPPPDGYTLSDRTCIPFGWKLGLILTHFLAFILLPIGLRVFFVALPRLGVPQRGLFYAMLAFGLLMTGIACEIGWHITQCWYYTNDFTAGNFMFYFFQIASFALWSDSFLTEQTDFSKKLDYVYAILLLLMSILYPIGARLDNDTFKVPIYITLTIAFVVLSYRAYVLLDKDRKVFLVPLFSIGVNMFFIFPLQAYGGDPYFHPNVAWNAFLHIAHDIGGTLLGVAILIYLVYKKGNQASGSERVPLVES